MKITDIHKKWGVVVEFDDPYEFFNQSAEFWRDLIYKKKLIIFKKMKFAPIDYAKFGNYFGRPWQHDEYFSSQEEPIELIDNGIKYSFSDFYQTINSANSSIDKNTEMTLHADIPNHKTHPFPFRSLWIVKKPNNNSGSTHWLNIEDCFDLLNPKLKSLLPQVSVIQQSWHNFGTDFRVLDLIKTHPITKRQSLRLNFYATEKIRNAWIVKVLIDSKPQKDCHLIQEYIDDLLQYKELYHSHIWDEYDIAIYDNHSFVHGRSPILLTDELDSNERRFYRMNIDHMPDDEFQNKALPPATSTSTIK